MLKKTLTHGAALALLISTSFVAHAAPSASSSITINGSVADTCTMSLAAASSSDVNATYAANTISITALADATTAVSTAASTELSIDGMCNYAHNMSIGSANGGMTHDGTVSVVSGSGTFDNLVEYDVSVAWANTVSLDAEGGAAVTATDAPGGAYSATGVAVSFNFDNNGGTDPLLSGAYTDTITLKLGATI